MNTKSNIRDEAMLARALQQYWEQGVPDGIEIWPSVEARLTHLLAAKRRVVPTRLRYAAVATALALILLGAGTVSASSTIRDAVTTNLGITKSQPHTTTGVSIHNSGNGGVIIGTKPATSFRVLSPDYLPQGLTVRYVAYIPARPTPQTGQKVIVVPQAPVVGGGPGGTQASSTPPAAVMSALAELGRSGVEAAYLSVSSPSTDGFMELVQTSSTAGQPTMQGEPIAVAGEPAQIQESGSETLLQMSRAGTVITIRTNLGRAEAIRVAENLRVG